ncbi:MAG: hypothetical protein KGI91_14855 [Burkholderiales bacterium]|nr:hypothetical protein [Burkholderiales bacterium]MDE2078327.1 hypothetical protein [Burkholderiales bacterium]MDE2432828.1 hypothetical protein [Burkholderiales bacterium]
MSAWIFKGMVMDAVEKAVKPTSVIPEWCNPSLLKEAAHPLPASSRIDWLQPAMSMWCADGASERPDAPRVFTPQLNS